MYKTIRALVFFWLRKEDIIRRSKLIFFSGIKQHLLKFVQYFVLAEAATGGIL